MRSRATASDGLHREFLRVYDLERERELNAEVRESRRRGGDPRGPGGHRNEQEREPADRVDVRKDDDVCASAVIRAVQSIDLPGVFRTS